MYDAMLAETVRESDAAAHICCVLRADHGIRVQRIAVAIQARNLHAGALEQSQKVVSRGVGGEDVIEHWTGVREFISVIMFN